MFSVETLVYKNADVYSLNQAAIHRSVSIPSAKNTQAPD